MGAHQGRRHERQGPSGQDERASGWRQAHGHKQQPHWPLAASEPGSPAWLCGMRCM